MDELYNSSGGHSLRSKYCFVKKPVFKELKLDIEEVVQEDGDLVIAFTAHQGYGYVSKINI
jgi:hypothetical protein